MIIFKIIGVTLIALFINWFIQLNETNRQKNIDDCYKSDRL